MALFMVLALKDSGETVDSAVREEFEDVYQVEPGKWIINADLATARQVSEQLGMREKSAHLVLSIRGYSGRAQPDLWEWLAAQSEKVDG